MTKKEKKAAKKWITIWIVGLCSVSMSVIGLNFGAYPKLVLCAWAILAGVNYLCWLDCVKRLK